MAKRVPERLTALETRVMDAVWDLGRATVKQVQTRLDGPKPLAYNTVLTMMRILRDKGFLDSRREGRVDVYCPCVSRDEMGRRSLREILSRFFAGSAQALVSQLLETQEISPEEIRAIRRKVDGRLRGGSH